MIQVGQRLQNGRYEGDAWLEQQLSEELSQSADLEKLVRMEQLKISQIKLRISKVQDGWGKGFYTPEEVQTKITEHREAIYETPEDLPMQVGVPKNYLKVLLHKALREGNALLNEEDSKKLLTTYGISTTMPHLARSAEEAVIIASEICYPVVMKISSPDISHKSDVGGVSLNISSDDEIRKAYSEIMDKIKQQMPDARVEGISIQKMIKNYDYELIAGS